MTAAPRPAPTPLRASLADLNLDKEVGTLMMNKRFGPVVLTICKLVCT
jgi:hypothetical protein